MNVPLSGRIENLWQKAASLAPISKRDNFCRAAKCVKSSWKFLNAAPLLKSRKSSSSRRLDKNKVATLFPNRPSSQWLQSQLEDAFIKRQQALRASSVSSPMHRLYNWIRPTGVCVCVPREGDFPVTLQPSAQGAGWSAECVIKCYFMASIKEAAAPCWVFSLLHPSVASFVWLSSLFPFVLSNLISPVMLKHYWKNNS